MCRHHQGVPLPDDPVIDYDYAGTGTALPPRPGLRPAAPHLLLDGLLHPRRVSRLVALSGLLPLGKGTLAPIRAMLASVSAGSGFASTWPERPRPWIVAVDHASGRRVVFGAPGHERELHTGAPVSPSASLAEAVTASCSIPGWYRPTVIDGVPYVDGGVASNASADLLMGAQLDEVYVLAPMGGSGRERPRSLVERLDGFVRRRVSATIERDVDALRARGLQVRVLAPTVEDLTTMGVNLMDSHARTEVLRSAQRTVADQLHHVDPLEAQTRQQ
jgi:NTE family protein